MLLVAAIAEFLALFLWLLIIRDAGIEREYSGSFVWLTPAQVGYAYHGSIMLCALAGLLSLICLFRRQKRAVAMLLLIISLILVPCMISWTKHVSLTTRPAVLEP